jgi:hypothetical protein
MDGELTVVSAPKKRYLVFTSAGDRAKLGRWITGDRNFDLWITYYGVKENRFQELADYYNRRRGGKFPNLHYAYRQWPEIFRKYDAVMVMDDDLVIRGSDLSRLFTIRERYDLWLLQPAFSPRGKISHRITRVDPRYIMRYTNFVEMGCPLFRTDKLERFLEVYDPVLVGYGMDWWFLEVLGPDLRGKVAVIDAISCINPDEASKGGVREIDTLQSLTERKQTWERIKRAYNIQSEAIGFQQYDAILAPFPQRIVRIILRKLRRRMRADR